VDIVDLTIGLVAFVTVFLLLIVSNRRYCLNKLKKAGAFSPETAVTPEKAGFHSDDLAAWARATLRSLVKKGKVKMTEDGRYYIETIGQNA